MIFGYSKTCSILFNFVQRHQLSGNKRFMETNLSPQIQRLLQSIEGQLDWGAQENWTNKDFEELSQHIFDKTGKQISVTTLKRLWGRAKLVANPSISTLDILAEFAGFHSWRGFNSQTKGNQKPSSPSVSKAAGYLMLLVGGIALVTILGFMLSRMPEDHPQEGSQQPLDETALAQVAFDFEKVSTGYPNTVIFKYDVGDIPYDSLEIQQSWDKSKRIKVNQPKGLATTTYYTSGYFNTKLVLNDQIIKQKDLYIPTDGWQARIYGNLPRLIYVDDEDILHKNHTLGFTNSVLDELNQYNPSFVSLERLDPQPRINSGTLELETEFRMHKATDKSICQAIGLVITGSKEVYRFQMSIPGCVGDLNFFLKMERVSGQNTDLSAFGIDPFQWTNFKLKNEENKLLVSINDQQIFEHQLSGDIGMVGGVQFTFEGIGEIRKLMLTDEDQELNLLD